MRVNAAAKIGRTMPLMGIGLAVLVLANSGTAFGDSWGFHHRPVRLTVFDEMGCPGETVTLRAKLEHDGPCGIHLHLRGYRVHFSSPSLVNQEATTGEEGTAKVSVRIASSVGVYQVQVRFAGSNHHQPAEATGQVFVWPPGSRVLVTDVDHTICDLSRLSVPFTPVRNVPPVAGAVEVLGELSRTYRVVYLSARDEILEERTRKWLKEKGFPEGPVFCRDFHIGQSQGTFKRQFIADLKKRCPGIVVGVGDEPSDANAYLSNGLKTFLINPEAKDHVPQGAVVVASWREMRQQLAEESRRP